MEIANKIIKSDLIEWRNLEWLQGKLKAIPENSLKKLKQSLINNSFVQPFNVWENGKLWILDGHHRKLAMEQLEAEGYNIPDKLPANFVECKNKKEASKMVLLYSSIYAKADEKSLDAFLAENEIDFSEVSGEIDLPELNLDTFGVNEIDDEKLDAVPEIQKDPISKLGDIFLIDGKHRVMCGDSTVKADVEALMAGKRANLYFTDPPYSVNFTQKSKEVLKNTRYTEIKNDNLTVKETSDNIWSPAFRNAYEICEDDASFYLTMPQGGDQMMMMMMNEHWQVKHELIWVKDAPVFSMNRLDYDYMHEPIAYGWKAKHNFYRKGDYQKSVWNIKRTENKLHPTMKPVALIENAILNSTMSNCIIYDSFLGSGSTLIASQQTNRICYGMELDPIYIDVILKRYKNLYPDAKFECLNRDFDFETLFSGN